MKLLLAVWLTLTPQPPTLCVDDCQLSDKGIALIQHFEGFMPFTYKDAAGLDTIGYGHLIRPGETFEQPMLPQQAEKLLRNDVAIAERAVNRRVTIALKQNQFDALTSFTFNTGEGALAKSTLLRRVNAARHTEVPAQFLRWVRAKGQILPGLVRRRQAEADLYAI
jgi:lysozyme